MTDSAGAPRGPGILPSALDLGFARLDLDRAARTGDPEVIYGPGKSPEHVVELLTGLHRAHPDRAVLATRLSHEALELVRRELPDAEADPVAGACTVGPLPAGQGLVTVVSAGTSDARVAHEASLTARVFGAQVRLVTDVGVAGLHRLLSVRADLEKADCLVVVAGMEGALPSVVGGLTGVPLVAVPTSIGYGASFGGIAALLAMLNSCAPGVAVVNIDNGFGAGVFAARVARRAAPRQPAVSDVPQGADGADGAGRADAPDVAGRAGRADAPDVADRVDRADAPDGAAGGHPADAIP
jgi:pyridinium-3,5-biscarboxylic acid mononucleotide synthase